MALTKVFAGYIYTPAGVPITGAYYQAHFNPNNTGSSMATWNATRQTDQNGYYSFNLGDSDFLTNDGVALANSIVTIAAWTGNVSRTDFASNNVTFITKTMTSESVYSNNIHVHPNAPPTTAFTAPATVQLGTAFTITNASTDGFVSGGEYQQGYNQQNISIFPQIRIGSVTFYHGDGSFQNSNAASDVSYTYDTFGQYAITGVSHDYLGLDGQPVVRNIAVAYRTPMPSFTRDITNPTILDTVVFTPAITDVDNRVSTVDWTVDSTLISGGLSKADQFSINFPVRGTRSILMTAYWNDGYIDKTTTSSALVAMANLAPVVSQIHTENVMVAKRYTFTSSSYDQDGSLVNYAWLVERQGNEGWMFEGSGSGAGLVSYMYTFATSGTYRITLTVTDDSGTQSSGSEIVNIEVDQPMPDVRYGMNRARTVNEGG